MNRYYEDDFENALECMRRMKYAQKTINLFIYAEWWIRLDIYEDFEKEPGFSGKEFKQKYKRIAFKR